MTETTREPSNIAYADETNYNVGRYRGLALITMRIEDSTKLSDNLRKIITESGITEFKWVDLRGARFRFAAQKMIDFSIQNSFDKSMRIDILIWDTEDNRHRVQGRDDIANLERMYYHLFKNVMHRRWSRETTWMLNPDKNSAINWEGLLAFLKMANLNETLKKSLKWETFRRYAIEFGIRRIEPKDSKDEPFIQLADLFAGIAVYSRSKYDYFEKWKDHGTRQTRLFEENPESCIILSKADEERCLILNYFNNNCKRKKLGVSLKMNKGLKTLDPTKPINFWWYEPQHDADKAPLRKCDH